MNQSYPSVNQSKRSFVGKQSTSSVYQLNSIQLLRGAAAVLVMAYHLSLYSAEHYKQAKLIGHLFGQGYAGVDLFFVISGFVITYSSFPAGRKPPTLLKYVYKRLIRIFPIYWLMLLIFWIACGVSYGNVPETGRRMSAWLTAFLLVPTHLPIIPVSWSLSHELFFYFVTGLVLYSRKLWLIPTFILAGTVYQLVESQPLTPLLWFVCSPYNIEFFGGVGIALLYQAKPWHQSLYWLTLGVSGLWLMVGPTADPGNQDARLLLYGLSSIGLLLALTGLERNRQISVPHAYTRLGDASYVLYLLHPSALALLYYYVDSRPSIPVWAFVFMSLALIILVAQVSIFIHQYLEKPLLDRLNKLIFRRLL